MEIGIAVGPRRQRPAVEGVDMRIAKAGSFHGSVLVIHTYNNMTAVRQAFTGESADVRRADLLEAPAVVLAAHAMQATTVRARSTLDAVSRKGGVLGMRVSVSIERCGHAIIQRKKKERRTE